MAVTQSQVWKTCAKLYQETGKRPTVEAVRNVTHGSNSTIGPWVRAWCDAFYLEGSTIESLPANAVKSIAALWSQLQEMATTDIEAIQEEQDQERAGLKDTIETLSAQLEAAQQQLETTQKELADTVKALEARKEDAANKQSTIDTLRHRLATRETDIAQLQHDMTALSSKHGDLIDEFESLQETNKHLQEDLRAREQSLDRINEQAMNLEREYSKTQNELHAAREENTSLKESLTSTEYNLIASEKEAKRLGQQVDNLNQTLAEHHKLTARLETYQQRTQEAESKLADAMARATKAEALHDQLQDNHKVSLGELMAARETITDLTAKLTAKAASKKPARRGGQHEG